MRLARGRLVTEYRDALHEVGRLGGSEFEVGGAVLDGGMEVFPGFGASMELLVSALSRILRIPRLRSVSVEPTSPAYGNDQFELSETEGGLSFS